MAGGKRPALRARVSNHRGMDPACYEDLRDRLLSLLIMLDQRLGDHEAGQVHEFIDVGEYGLALEEMAGALSQAWTPITDQERSDMLALTHRMKMDEQVPGALESCPCRP